MQKWEYFVVRPRGTDLEVELLNQLGEQGWELVAYVEDHAAFILKRRRT
jgi:hypothetical protein